MRPFRLHWIFIYCLLAHSITAQYNDCDNALAICDNSNLNFSGTGPGINDFADPDNDSGCLLFNEHQSTWLIIKISQLSPPGATLGFTLNPSGTTNLDFDFAVFGPSGNCGNLGTPIRCSYANDNFSNCTFCPQTGLGMGETDPVEGALGNGFVANLIVQPGDIYYILIDNFNASEDGFSLEWTGGAVLDCNLNCFATAGSYQVNPFPNNQTQNFPNTAADIENYILCNNDGIILEIEDDFILPDPAVGEDATLLWALYDSPPPIFPTPTDPGFTGNLVDEDFVSELNSNGINSNLPNGLNLTNNTLWLIPVVGDDGNTSGNNNGQIGIDTNGDGCYEYGTPVSITYLNNIEVAIQNFCIWPQFTIGGGMPEFFGGGYEITNLLPITATVSNYAPTLGEIVVISNLQTGQAYSFNVTDGNGCEIEVSGVFDFNGASPEIVVADSIFTCPGANALLVAETDYPGINYQWQWSGPNGYSSTEQSPEIVNPVSGIYTVSLNVDGCGANDQTTFLDFQPAPTLDPILPQDVCGTSFDLADIGLNGSLLQNAGFDFYANSGNAPGQQINSVITASGTYWIQASFSGQQSCSDYESVEIVLNTIVISVNFVQNVSCEGEDDGAINTSISGGEAPYFISWSGTNDDEEDITDLDAGTYGITVTDVNGCTSEQSIEVEEPEELDFEIIEIINPSCPGDPFGSATIQVIGGTPPYAYSWSNGGNTPGLFDVDISLEYDVTITDANGCTEDDNDVLDFDEPDDAEVVAEVENATCGEANGAIELDDSGDAGDLIYQWSHDASIDGDDADNLLSGNYTITVTDENNCVYVVNVFVGTTDGPQVDLLAVVPESCSQNNGSAIITVSGNLDDLDISWSHDQNLAGTEAAFLEAGDYLVTVTDSLGCSNVLEFTVPLDDELEIIVDDIELTSCAETNNGSATLDVSGGTAPYVFTWSHDSANASDEADNLPYGEIVVAVTDANNCVQTFTFFMDAINDQSLDVATIVNPTCGQADGSIVLSFVNAPGPITYQWSSDTSLNGPIATNIASGVYEILATDANGCTDFISVNLNNVDGPLATFSEIEPSGCTAEDGSLSTLVNGAGPFTYQWSHNSALNNPNANNLDNGYYTVTITDVNGCTNEFSEWISYDDDVEIIPLNIVHTMCGLLEGEILLTTVGGVGPYEYDWEPEVSTDSFAVNLGAGVYTISSTDANGCVDYITVNILGTGILGFDIDFYHIKHENCGQGNGEISITVQNDMPVEWLGHPDFGSATELMSLSAAVYQALAPGVCNMAENVMILNIPAPVLQVDSTMDLTCSQNTLAALSASGGDGELSYTWSHDNNLDTNYIENLPLGDYSVTVTDEYGCADSLDFVIDEVLPPVAQIENIEQASCGQNNGSASVIAFGGTGVITYSWSHNPFVTSPQATFLAAGDYSVTIGDDNGCAIVLDIEVPGQDIPVLFVENLNSANCGQSNGSASVGVNSGFPPYAFEWTHDSANDTNVAEDLSSGAYTVYVTDFFGCMDSLLISIPDQDAPSIDIVNVTEDSCGAGVGQILIAGNGGDGALTYAWSNDPLNTSELAENLSAGLYSVTVEDEAGCKAIEIIEIETTIVPLINLLSASPSYCESGEGSILVLVTNSVFPTQYNWAHDNSINLPFADQLFTGDYELTVTSGNGCTAETSVFVPGTTIPILSLADLSPVTCVNPEGYITVATENGTPPFVYTWSHDNTLTGPIANGLAGGVSQTYTIAVTDTIGCQNNIEIPMPDFTLPMLHVDSIWEENCGVGDGALQVQANPFALYRINCGYEIGETTDRYGNVFAPDNFHDGGTANLLSGVVFNSGSENIHGSFRNDVAAFNYHFPVLNGDYLVKLSFVETSDHLFNIVNPNYFDLQIEGVTVMDDFSIYENFGTRSTGFLEFTTTVIDANLDLNFIAEAMEVKVSSIEIIAMPQPVFSFQWSQDPGLNGNFAPNLSAGSYSISLNDDLGCEATFEAIVGSQDLGPVVDVEMGLDSCNNGYGTIDLMPQMAPYHRINVGGPEYTTLDGRYFEADEVLNPAFPIINTTANFANTNDDVLYQTARQDNLTYAFNLPNGQYMVRLHFAEMGTNPSSVTDAFNVEFDGSIVLNNYNIAVAAGGTQTVVVEEHMASVLDGVLNIRFGNIIASTSLSALEVLPLLNEPTTFNYSWSHDNTLGNSEASNLLAGDYTVTIFDNSGCSTVLDYIVEPSPQTLVEVSAIIPSDCDSSTGGIELVSLPEYTFNWSHDSNLTGNIATDLAPGDYIVTLTDNYGCNTIDTFPIPASSPNEFDLVTIVTPGCDLFNGSAMIGGEAIFHINSGGSTFISPTTEHLFDGDNYVTGGIINTINDNIENTEEDALYQVYRLGNFQYEFPIVDNGMYDIVLHFQEPNQTNRIFDVNIENQLVEDNLSVFNEAGFTTALIKKYNILVSDGMLNVNLVGVGGNAILSAIEVYKSIPTGTQFSWSQDVALNSPTAGDLTAGNYSITITESNGCSSEMDIEITEPEQPYLFLIGSVEPAACLGVFGSAQIDVLGNSPFNYQWSHNSSLNSPTAENLLAGDYMITVTDVNNCKDTLDVNLNDLSLPQITLDSLANTICGLEEGTIFATASGGAGSFQYSWSHDDTLSLPIATELPSGIYTLEVTDKNGCIAQETFVIGELGPQVELVLIEDTQCSELLGSIYVTEVGQPFGGYQFFWPHDPTLQDSFAVNLAGGNYTVIAVDANGCGDTLVANVGNADGPALLDILTHNPDSCYVETGWASLQISGGTGLISYEWSHDPLLSNSVATNLGSGNYSVTITDENDCFNEENFEIVEPTLFDINLASTQIETCESSNAAAVVLINGGNEPLSFVWSHDNTINSNVLSDISAGTYSVTVTDAKFCVDSLELEVDGIVGPLITDSNVESAYCTTNSGQISISVQSEADSVYYSWSHDPDLDLSQAAGLPAGNYTVTVYDNFNCQVLSDFEIPTQLDTILFTLETTLCEGDLYEFAGSFYETDTTLTVVYPSFQGCDSVFVNNVYFYDNSITMLSSSSCDPNEIGLFMDSLSNINGCDSLVLTEVTLLSTDSTHLFDLSCDPDEVGVFINNFSNENGCDSIVITTVGLLLSDTTYLVGTSCDPNETGLFTNSLINENGCDSTTITTIDLLLSDTIYLVEASCDSDETGVFTNSLINGNGCDSLIITTIDLLLPDTTFVANGSCDPDETGIFTTTLMNENGCDSTVITTVELFLPDTTYLMTASCDPNEVGTFTNNFFNLNGCDSLVVTEVSFLPTDTIYLFSGSCDSTEIGVFIDTLSNQFGCDSVVVNEIAFQNNDLVNVTISSCNLADVGVFVDSLLNVNGCDSVVVTEVAFLLSDTTYAFSGVCSVDDVGVELTLLSNQFGCDSLVINESLYWNPDTIYVSHFSCEPNEVGVFSDSYLSVNGCDSTVITTVDLLFSDTTYLTNISCDPDDVGVFTNSLTNANGCDSLVITEINLLPSDTTYLFFGSCDSTDIGIFMETLNNQFGCDSMVVTEVSFLNNHDITLDEYSCDPDEVGFFVDSLFSISGCDSVVVTTVSLLESDTTYLSGFSCDVNDGGIFIDILTNIDGCDSTIITEVEILPSDTTTLFEFSCDPDDVGSFSNTLVNQYGCDSLLIVETILLHSDTTYFGGSTCNANEAGTFTETLTNYVGCDSLLITEVELLPSDTTYFYETSCDAEEQGVFYNTLNNQFACDSIIVTEIALLPMDSTVITSYTCDPEEADLFLGEISTNMFGCDSLIFQEIVPTNNGLNIYVPEGLEADYGQAIEIEVGTNFLPDSIYWTPSEYLNCANCLNPFASIFETTSFSIVMTDAFGCLTSADLTIEVDLEGEVYIPSAFSPNHDGINDVFLIYSGKNIKEVQTFRIFSRWGELVYENNHFQTNDPAFGWDGYFKEEAMNPGVFAWFAVVEYVDGETELFKGDVSLLK